MSNINGLSNLNSNSVYLFGNQGQTGASQDAQSNQGTQSAAITELIKDLIEVKNDLAALQQQQQGQGNALLNNNSVQGLLGGQNGQSGQIDLNGLSNLLQAAQNGGTPGLGGSGQGQATQSDLMSFLGQGSSGSSGQGGLLSGQGTSGGQIDPQMMSALQSIASTLSSGGNGGGLLSGGGSGLGSASLQSASFGQDGQAGLLSNQQDFTDGKDFSIESKGDPHLSATINGVTTKHDNMGSQADLIDANASFVGGYQVSTTASGADKDGKTYNQKVGVQTDGNTVSVEHKDDGDPTVTVTNNATGSSQTLSQGQSITTDHGATINYGKDGKVQVSNNSSDGGTINTSISDNGHGLDSKTDGKNVRIGGYEAAYAAREAAGSSQSSQSTT